MYSQMKTRKIKVWYTVMLRIWFHLTSRFSLANQELLTSISNETVFFFERQLLFDFSANQTSHNNELQHAERAKDNSPK